ncbi:MAG TPA: hypothetical protein V6C69_01410 [Trichormus sp.]
MKLPTRDGPSRRSGNLETKLYFRACALAARVDVTLGRSRLHDIVSADIAPAAASILTISCLSSTLGFHGRCRAQLLNPLKLWQLAAAP